MLNDIHYHCYTVSLQESDETKSSVLLPYLGWSFLILIIPP